MPFIIELEFDGIVWFITQMDGPANTEIIVKLVGLGWKSRGDAGANRELGKKHFACNQEGDEKEVAFHRLKFKTVTDGWENPE